MKNILSLLILSVIVTGCTGKLDMNGDVNAQGGTITGSAPTSPVNPVKLSKISYVNPADKTLKLEGSDQVIKPQSEEVANAIASGEIKEGDSFTVIDSDNLQIVSNGKVYRFNKVEIRNCEGCKIS